MNSNKIARNIYTKKMAEELENLMILFEISNEELSKKIGLDKRELTQIMLGERELQWSEYLAILFLFWRNDNIRQVIEEKELFPEELKQMMTAERSSTNI